MKTPPSKAYPAWTTARFFGFIRSALRASFRRWPPKYNTLKNAARTVDVMLDGESVRFKTGKRVGEVKTTNQYHCNICKEWFKQKEVQVDHIIGAGSLNSFDDVGPFVERLFVGEDGLQVLCEPCHHIKTQEEKKNARS